jgi:hypothetical protein
LIDKNPQKVYLLNLVDNAAFQKAIILEKENVLLTKPKSRMLIFLIA